MTPSLTYEDAGHIYRLEGQQIPGVTRVLSDMGFNGKGSAFYTESSRQLGTAVHRACAAVDRHAPEATTLSAALEVFASPLHPDLHPYLTGWLMFKREHGYRSRWWEEPMHSSRLRIAGTPDTVGTADNNAVIVDVKTWKAQGQKPKRSAELQLAGYAIMLSANQTFLPERVQRWIVKVPGDGGYRLYRCTNMADFGVVSAAAICWHELHALGVYRLTGDPEVGYSECG